MITTNLIFSGVGGQGVLLIAELTALTAVQAGYDVKQTEVHGVSQRGGSVESHVRFGPEIHSPLVRRGQADVVVGLEKLEGLRYAEYLRPSSPTLLPSGSSPTGEGGILLVNDHEIIPGSVVNAAEHYPHHALELLRDKGVRVIAVPASQQAKDLGDGRMANMILLGALAGLLNLPAEAWRATLQAKLPAKLLAPNLRAFEAGQKLIATSAPREAAISHPPSAISH